MTGKIDQTLSAMTYGKDRSSGALNADGNFPKVPQDGDSSKGEEQDLEEKEA